MAAGGGSHWWGSTPYVPIAPVAIPSFLEAYGYLADDSGKWKVARPGPQVELSVTGHEEFQGYTLYKLDCALVVPREGGDQALRFEWKSKRRLTQLREELHARVKQEVGERAYAAHFAAAPFAQKGGLPGTTSRLNNWCKALAACVNEGAAPPSTVALLLHYLQAPEPIDPEAEKATEVRFLPGEDAEVLDLQSSDWLKCRITGAGAVKGSYNIRVLPSSAAKRHGMVGQEGSNIALSNLRKFVRTYTAGEDVEVIDFKTNEWLSCRIVGKGSEFGTFNLRVHASEAAARLGLADQDAPNISPEHLRKAPCAYVVGENAEVLDLPTSAWVRSVVTGADAALGTYNIRVLPSEVARLKNLAGKEGTGIHPEHMRKVPRHTTGSPTGGGSPLGFPNRPPPVKAAAAGALPGAAGLNDIQFSLEGADDADDEEGARPAGDIVITFRTPEGELEEVSFAGRHPPFGMDFKKAQPLEVRHVKEESHAAELGVKPGWGLVAFNGTNVEDKEYVEVFRLIQAALGYAMSSGTCSSPTSSISSSQFSVQKRGSLVILFLLPDGTHRRVDFTGAKPPLGMDFKKEQPIAIRVVRGGSVAEERGVEEGWQVVEVNDVPVSGKTFLEVFAEMKVAMLPAP